MRFQTVVVGGSILAIFLLFSVSGVSGYNVSFKGGENDEFKVSFTVNSTHSDEVNNTSDLGLPPKCHVSSNFKNIFLVAVLVILLFIFVVISYAFSAIKTPKCLSPHESGTSDSGILELQKISVDSEEGEDGDDKPLTMTMNDSPV